MPGWRMADGMLGKGGDRRDDGCLRLRLPPPASSGLNPHVWCVAAGCWLLVLATAAQDALRDLTTAPGASLYS